MIYYFVWILDISVCMNESKYPSSTLILTTHFDNSEVADYSCPARLSVRIFPGFVAGNTDAILIIY